MALVNHCGQLCWILSATRTAPSISTLGTDVAKRPLQPGEKSGVATTTGRTYIRRVIILAGKSQRGVTRAALYSVEPCY